MPYQVLRQMYVRIVILYHVGTFKDIIPGHHVSSAGNSRKKGEKKKLREGFQWHWTLGVNLF